jgi:hypothetical protein
MTIFRLRQDTVRLNTDAINYIDINADDGVTHIGRDRTEIYEDFLLQETASLPQPWGTQNTSAAGSPTLSYIDSAANGVFHLAHDGTNEAQTLTLHFNDQLVIDSTKGPIFEARLKVNFAGATFSADQRVVFGLASARNATLDSIVNNAWFRIEGANLNILVESDDGTTDTDDTDTGVDIVDNTYIKVRIDMRDLSQIRFFVDDVLAGTLAASAMTGILQPFIEIQRDAGTEQEQVHIDYISVSVGR